MAWSRCDMEIGLPGDDGTMATTLVNIGTIKDKSASLEATDGETLEMKATGGITVAKEILEGGYLVKVRVIEPDIALLEHLGIVGAKEGEDVTILTHIVDGYRSLRITPKNVGAKGIEAPMTSVTYKPGWSEEDGNYADLEFDILKGDAQYWYKMFTKPAQTATTTTTSE